VTDRSGWARAGALANGMFVNGRTKIALVAAIGLAVLISVPLWANNYWLRVLTEVAMLAILASSWNIIAGICGYFSFGNVVFFGLGAYTTAVLMSGLGTPFLLTVVLGGAVAVVFAVLIGVPLLRLKGHYFAIATLAINLATREVVTNLDWTGGGKGIWLQIPDFEPRTFSLLIFYAMVLLLAVTVGTVWLILRSRWGYAMRAIRGNEEAAAVLGIYATYYKVLGFAVSAAFAGIAGSVYAYWLTYIEPTQAFDMNLNIHFVMAGLLGGLGTVLGPLLGAIVLQLLSESIWSHFLEVHFAVLGVLIILVVLFLPGGLMSLLQGYFPQKREQSM